MKVIDKNLPAVIGPRGGRHPRKIDVQCEACLTRHCYHPCENKGSFTQGRGYTSYYKNPEWVCMYRHQYGCPDEFC